MAKSSIETCFDVVLPPWMRREARRLALEENPENGARGALISQKKWKPGRALRVRFLDGLPDVQNKVREMALEWTQYANIGLVFGSDPDAEIRISFAADPGSWSFMGTDNLVIPRNQPTMNFGWLKANSTETEISRVSKHELGHALGLIHEHQHPETNIPWDKPVVYEHYMRTQGWTKEEVDLNLFQKYSVTQTQFSAYDRDSIMHYPVDEKFTTGSFTVGWNTKLSATDKAFIATAYPGLKTTPGVTALAVGAAPTSAAIGAHGEQDVFSFSITKKGVYTVETQGKTDVYLSLFNGSDQLVAEDDDSGLDTNSRVVSTLQPGTYTLRVRHYRPTGTGQYSVSVKAGS